MKRNVYTEWIDDFLDVTDTDTSVKMFKIRNVVILTSVVLRRLKASVLKKT